VSGEAGAHGLTSAEAARRLAAAGPRRRPRTSRSYAEIVWSNTVTVFNLILGSLLAIILAFGEYQDALFGGVIVANTLIGIIQEVRAKRVLDRLALLVAPRARARRDGEVVEIPVAELVAGDVVRLEPGDQVVADGRVVGARGLLLDESILTGESAPVPKAEGDRVLSGAFCVAGSGEYLVEAVGEESYAERLAAEARGARTAPSPLQVDINRVLRGTVAVMIPLAVALVVSIAIRGDDLVAGAERSVAALVPLVPEGLVLLTSLTFAVAAVQLARVGTLAQRLNAVESLASVDTVCLDKTGTLTENRLRVVAIEPADGTDEAVLRADLATLAASVGTRNATMQAIAEAAPGSAAEVLAEVPFSSARRWSGISIAGRTLVLGAPEVLERLGVAVGPRLREQIAAHAAARRRVVLAAAGTEPLADGGRLPPVRATGIVVLSEGLKPDAPPTVAFLCAQGVELKIISGDAPATVQAVARAAGVPHADRAVSGQDLPEDPEALAAVAARTTVFGRITPEQKRELVRALTRLGRYVAMVGDGVNDVLALKEARLAVAMGNGSQMAKGVADLVLLTSSFATVPLAVEEGRRILRNTHRVATLFVSKSVYAAVLLATLGLAPIEFPFLPRHLSVTSSLTIGIPAFVLALARSSGPVQREGFLAGLLAFTLPAGTIAAAVIAAGYLVVRGPLDGGVVEGRTVAVLLATAMGLAILVQVERGLERRAVRPWVWGMVVFFAVALTAGLQLSGLRDFFAVQRPSPAAWGVVAACAAAGVLLLLAVRRIPALARIESRGSG
jgi:cation-transporting ATPase E/undecaprenyl-diphosphatase